MRNARVETLAIATPSPAPATASTPDLTEQLPDNVASRTSERGTNRHFVLALYRAHQEESGDIDTRNQQENRGRSEHQPHRSPNWFDDLCVERLDVGR